MRGEVGKKTPKKEMENPSFTLLIFETLCPATKFIQRLKMSIKQQFMRAFQIHIELNTQLQKKQDVIAFKIS